MFYLYVHLYVFFPVLGFVPCTYLSSVVFYAEVPKPSVVHSLPFFLCLMNVLCALRHPCDLWSGLGQFVSSRGYSGDFISCVFNYNK